MDTIVESNPNYKTDLGHLIHEFVNRIDNKNFHDTISLNTFVQLPINEIHLFLKDYDLLKKRVAEAKHKRLISL